MKTKTPSKKSNLYWAVALVAMAIFFSFGAFLTYNRLTRQLIDKNLFEKDSNATVAETEPAENTEEVVSKLPDDQKKSPPKATESILRDLDEMQKLPVEGSYDVNSFDNLE